MVNQIDKIDIEDKRRKVYKEYNSIKDNTKGQTEDFSKKITEFIKKHLNKRNAPIAKLINTTGKVQENQSLMSTKLQKMIERV